MPVATSPVRSFSQSLAEKLPRWSIRVLSALAFVAIGVLGFSTTANAAPSEIPNAITSVTLTGGPGPYGQGDTVTFSGAWAVPDNSQPGDTFTLQLPSELTWQGSTTFSLTNSSGDVIATAQANPDGTVVFALAPYVAHHPHDINGTFTFATQYTATQTTPGTETLVFDVNATAIPVPIPVAGNGADTGHPADVASPYKTMIFTTPQETATRSYITGNVGNADINTVVITDNPGPGLAIDCASISPLVGHNIGQFGDIVAPDDTALYPPTIDCSPSSLTVTWTGIPAHENLGVYVFSTITDSSLASYSNAGTFVVNGTSTPVSAIVQNSTASGTGDSSVVPPAGGTTPTPPATPGTVGPTVETGGYIVARATTPLTQPWTIGFAVAAAVGAGLAASVMAGRRRHLRSAARQRSTAR